MTDIVEKLRLYGNKLETDATDAALMMEAADTIERLRFESQHRLEMLQRQKTEIEHLKHRPDTADLHYHLAGKHFPPEPE